MSEKQCVIVIEYSGKIGKSGHQLLSDSSWFSSVPPGKYRDIISVTHVMFHTITSIVHRIRTTDKSTWARGNKNVQ